MKLGINSAGRKEGIYFIIKERVEVRVCCLINFNISSALHINRLQSRGSLVPVSGVLLPDHISAPRSSVCPDPAAAASCRPGEHTLAEHGSLGFLINWPFESVELLLGKLPE